MAETHITGPLLVGKSSEFGQDAINGSSTAPLVSFDKAQNFGYYVVSSAEVRFTATRITNAYTSGGMKIGTTGLESTTPVGPMLYIPQTTGSVVTSSGSSAGPVALNSGAALLYDAGRKKLCIFSTLTSEWVTTAAMTSS